MNLKSFWSLITTIYNRIFRESRFLKVPWSYTSIGLRTIFCFHPLGEEVKIPTISSATRHRAYFLRMSFTDLGYIERKNYGGIYNAS